MQLHQENDAPPTQKILGNLMTCETKAESVEKIHLNQRR